MHTKVLTPLVIFMESMLTFIPVKEMKSSVHTHLNYRFIITLPFIPSASSTFATVHNYVVVTARVNTSDQGDITQVSP
jgi:hypothetical protein